MSRTARSNGLTYCPKEIGEITQNKRSFDQLRDMMAMGIRQRCAGTTTPRTCRGPT